LVRREAEVCCSGRLKHIQFRQSSNGTHDEHSGARVNVANEIRYSSSISPIAVGNEIGDVTEDPATLRFEPKTEEQTPYIFRAATSF